MRNKLQAGTSTKLRKGERLGIENGTLISQEVDCAKKRSASGIILLTLNFNEAWVPFIAKLMSQPSTRLRKARAGGEHQ